MRGTSKIRRLLLVAVVAVATAACTAPVSPPSHPSGDRHIGLNQLQFIGTHNAYHRHADFWFLGLLSIGAQLFPDLAGKGLDPAQINYDHRPLTEQLDSGLRSFELDVWADPTGGRFAKPLAAQLFGQPYPTGVDGPGLKVFHIPEIDYLSTCPTLTACLQEMRTWSDAHPGHLPITIDIELEEDPLPAPFDVTPIQPFDATRLDVLDTTIRNVVGDRLITPDDVRRSAPDLRTAVTTPGSGGGWPSVHDSRGRFLFFMDNAGSPALRYLDGHPDLRGRVLFTSDGFDRSDAAVLKVNDPGDGSQISALVREGFLVRTRADADVVAPGADRAAALASGAQMVHSDFPKGEPQPWTGYEVSFPTAVQARCNPVNTTPSTCRAAAAIEPTVRPAT